MAVGSAGGGAAAVAAPSTRTGTAATMRQRAPGGAARLAHLHRPGPQTRRCGAVRPLPVAAHRRTLLAWGAGAAAVGDRLVAAAQAVEDPAPSPSGAADASLDEVFVPSPDDPPTYVTAPGRIVGIGDLHGDLPKAVVALRIAGVLEDDNGKPVWVGGDTTLVQLGDVLDRGDNEIAIVVLLRELDRQARAEGGAVYMLNGNHESLNVCGDFRYVTAGAFKESAIVAGLQPAELKVWDRQLAARLSLYTPGGAMAREFARNSTVLVVNDIAFAHGGLLPIHTKYGLERMNSEVGAWMRGDALEDGSKAAPPFIAMGDANSVMWNRTYGKEAFPTPFERYHACAMLEQALDDARARMLVVGHTPQMGGCNCECDGRIWRIDVGMSSGVLNAMPQVVEFVKEDDGGYAPRVLSHAAKPKREDPRVKVTNSSSPATRVTTSTGRPTPTQSSTPAGEAPASPSSSASSNSQFFRDQE